MKEAGYDMFPKMWNFYFGNVAFITAKNVFKIKIVYINLKKKFNLCNKCRGASAWTKYKNQNFFCDIMQENVHVWCVFPVCLLLFCLRCNTESEWHQIHENIIKKANSRYNLSGSNTGEKQDASFKVLEKLRVRPKDVKNMFVAVVDIKTFHRNLVKIILALMKTSAHSLRHSFSARLSSGWSD